jgi:pyruvate formate lyase activating enzyme
VYGFLSASNFDPVEKKPLYHFHPGKDIFSMGSLGCNFHCKCCQNFHISQTGKDDISNLTKMNLSEIVKNVKLNPSNIGVAYTYNEPVVWYEYMIDIAKEIAHHNYKNVVVSNGFINSKPLNKLIEYIDAFNIDLKGFNDEMYRSFAGGKLKNVLQTLKIIKEKGRHLEITFLAVTDINDNMNEFQEMGEWIVQNLGADVPLHISRYFPNYKHGAKATSSNLLWNMAKLAGKSLNYVYVGNMHGNEFQNTICPNCNKVVVNRIGYSVNTQNLTSEGNCLSCGYNVAIV